MDQFVDEDYQELFIGDEVYWTDPDDGRCSGYYSVIDPGESSFESDAVVYIGKGGTELEAFRHELS